MNTDRTAIVAAAAAHDFNNDLTVILSGVTEALRCLEAGHPSRAYLLDLRAAAQRCVWRASGLLNFSAKSHTGPVRASFENLTRI